MRARNGTLTSYGVRCAVSLLLSACAASPTKGTSPETAPPTATAPPTVTAPPPATPSPSTAAAAPEPVPSEPPAPRGPDEPLTAEGIKAVVRASYDTMTACYLKGLKRDPRLGGTIDVHLVIDDDGEVVGATAPKGPKKKGDERLLDPEVVGCVEQAFMKLTFPPTGRGMMTFTYPVVFHVE